MSVINRNTAQNYFYCTNKYTNFKSNHFIQNIKPMTACMKFFSLLRITNVTHRLCQHHLFSRLQAF